MNTRVNNSRHRIPAKSLCNIPGLFTEEMIRDGWILRNEIIWHKPVLYSHTGQRPVHGRLREDIFLRKIAKIRFHTAVRTVCRVYVQPI